MIADNFIRLFKLHHQFGPLGTRCHVKTVQLKAIALQPQMHLFEGTKGRLFVNRGKITGTPIQEEWDKGQFGDAELSELYKGKPFEGHKNNFYRCIAEGGLPVSDVYSHVQTMNTCHLCSIAARLNRVIKWDPAKEEIVGVTARRSKEKS